MELKPDAQRDVLLPARVQLALWLQHWLALLMHRRARKRSPR